MIDSFRVWLIGLLSVSLILTVLSTLLPEGSVKKIAGVTGGLVLLLVVLRGVVRLDLTNIQLSYDSCAQEITRQMERYQEKSKTELEELIARRTAAYISEQAQSLGVSCTSQVSLHWTEDNIPVPAGVTLDIPYHAKLEEIMESNLGIKAENQVWSTSEG